MTETIERFILFLFLTAFAIYGVLYGAPKAGEVLRERMEMSVQVK